MVLTPSAVFPLVSSSLSCSLSFLWNTIYLWSPTAHTLLAGSEEFILASDYEKMEILQERSKSMLMVTKKGSVSSIPIYSGFP